MPVWLGIISLAGIVFSGIMSFLSRSKASEALAQGQQNHNEGRAAAEKADEKSDALAKADQIHDLTNSRLSEMDRKLAVAMETIAGLQKQLALMVLAKAEAENRSESKP